MHERSEYLENLTITFTTTVAHQNTPPVASASGDISLRPDTEDGHIDSDADSDITVKEENDFDTFCTRKRDLFAKPMFVYIQEARDKHLERLDERDKLKRHAISQLRTGMRRAPNLSPMSTELAEAKSFFVWAAREYRVEIERIYDEVCGRWIPAAEKRQDDSAWSLEQIDSTRMEAIEELILTISYARFRISDTRQSAGRARASTYGPSIAQRSDIL